MSLPRLSASVVRTTPSRRRRKPRQPATILGGLVSLMVGSFVLAFLLHVGGHWHQALLKRQARLERSQEQLILADERRARP